jgi:hypothetical protein
VLGEARPVTVDDVLDVFAGSTLVACSRCGSTRWRSTTSTPPSPVVVTTTTTDDATAGLRALGMVCAACHPGPDPPPPPPVPAIPVPRDWRAPKTSTTRLRREIVFARPGARAPRREEVVRRTSGPWQACLQCGGHDWIRSDARGDRCATCDP